MSDNLAKELQKIVNDSVNTTQLMERLTIFVSERERKAWDLGFDKGESIRRDSRNEGEIGQMHRMTLVPEEDDPAVISIQTPTTIDGFYTTNLTKFMTGQEWYDRFISEASTYDFTTDETNTLAVIAHKAAGLDDGEKKHA